MAGPDGPLHSGLLPLFDVVSCTGPFGTLEGVTDPYLLKRQLAVPLMHTLGVLTGRGYVSSWTPLLGVATFGSLAWIAAKGLRLIATPPSWRWEILAPVLVVVLTTNRVLFHFFYINGHMLFAGLLLGGVGLAWLSGAWPLLLPASLMFGALIPLRAESAIVVGVFLVVFVTSHQIPVRWRWTLILPTIVATLLWDGPVHQRPLTEQSLELMRSPLAEIAIMVGLIVLTAARGSRRFSRFGHVAPWTVLVSLGIFLGLHVLQDSQVMIMTISGMSASLGAAGLWGGFWLVVPLLLIGTAIVGVNGGQCIQFGSGTLVLIIPILAYMRGAPFHEEPHDSANRMLMHIVPLVALSVAMALGTTVRWPIFPRRATPTVRGTGPAWLRRCPPRFRTP
jgi:hypothetical protein